MTCKRVVAAANRRFSLKTADGFLSVLLDSVNPQVFLQRRSAAAAAAAARSTAIRQDFSPVCLFDKEDVVGRVIPERWLVATVTCLRCLSRTGFCFQMKMCTTAFGVYGIEQRLDFLIFLWSCAEKKSSRVFMCVCVLLRTSQRDAGGCLGYLIQSRRAGFTPLTMHDRGICSDRHCVPPHSNWMKNVRRINIRSIFEKHSLNVLQTQKKCRFFSRSPSTLKVQIRLSSTFFSLRACVILGVVFILSSLCILGKAIHDLATKLLPEVVRVDQLNPKGLWCRRFFLLHNKSILLLFSLRENSKQLQVL